MTDTEIQQQVAAREFADCMPMIVYAVDHCEKLMVRLGVGRVR